MQKIRVFTPNEKGKIEFTKSELEKLLNEVYQDGHRDGKNDSYTITTPSYPFTWATRNVDAITTTTTTKSTPDITLEGYQADTAKGYVTNTTEGYVTNTTL